MTYKWRKYAMFNKRDKGVLILRNSDGLGLEHGQSHMNRIGNISYEFDYSEDGIGLGYGQPPKTNQLTTKNDGDPRRDLSKLDTTSPHIKYEYREFYKSMKTKGRLHQKKPGSFPWGIFSCRNFWGKGGHVSEQHFQRRRHYYNIGGPVSKASGDWYNIEESEANNRLLWDSTELKPKVVKTDIDCEVYKKLGIKNFFMPLLSGNRDTAQEARTIIDTFDNVTKEALENGPIGNFGRITTSNGDITKSSNTGSPTFGSGDSTNTTTVSTQLITTSQIVNVSNFSITLIAQVLDPDINLVIQTLNFHFFNKGIPVRLQIQLGISMGNYTGVNLNPNSYNCSIKYNQHIKDTETTITTTTWSSNWVPPQN